MRALQSTVLIVLALIGLASPARGDQPITGTKLVVKDNVDVAKRKVQFASNDPNVHVSGGPADTAFISFQIFNSNGTGESECWPNDYWGYAAERPNAGFKSGTTSTNGCSGRINQGLFRIKCTPRFHPISYSLDESSQGSMGVVVRVEDTAGITTYCSDFGGTIVRDSATQRAFSARKAPAPAVCPTPPASCP